MAIPTTDKKPTLKPKDPTELQLLARKQNAYAWRLGALANITAFIRSLEEEYSQASGLACMLKNAGDEYTSSQLDCVMEDIRNALVMATDVERRQKALVMFVNNGLKVTCKNHREALRKYIELTGDSK